jgi:hypothetical protein
MDRVALGRRMGGRKPFHRLGAATADLTPIWWRGAGDRRAGRSDPHLMALGQSQIGLTTMACFFKNATCCLSFRLISSMKASSRSISFSNSFLSAPGFGTVFSKAIWSSHFFTTLAASRRHRRRHRSSHFLYVMIEVTLVQVRLFRLWVAEWIAERCRFWNVRQSGSLDSDAFRRRRRTRRNPPIAKKPERRSVMEVGSGVEKTSFAFISIPGIVLSNGA